MCVFVYVCVFRLQSHLLVALLVQQFAQIVQAAGDGALVGVWVLEVLVWDVGAGQEGASGLVAAALVHQDDPRIQVSGCRESGETLRHGVGLERKITAKSSIQLSRLMPVKIGHTRACARSHVHTHTYTHSETHT